MFKKFGIIFVMAILIAGFQACDNNEENVLINKDVFIASGHPDWPPIMYQNPENEKEIIGAGAELNLMIFNELGLKAKSHFAGSWDIVQEKTKGGEVDMIVAAYKTTEREKYMEYTIPYTIDPISVFVKKGNFFSFENWEDLIGKKGVITKGDSYGQEFDNFIAKELDVIIADSPNDAFAIIVNGEADYFIYATYAGEEAMKNSEDLAKQIEILPKYVCTEDFYMTISKQSILCTYLPQINAILQRLIDNGTVDMLIKKYENK